MSQSASYNRESTAPSLFDEVLETTSTQDWKGEVNRRLAAHRNRQHSANGEQRTEHTSRQNVQNTSRAAQAAARVAARYANAPTYQDLFGSNAEAVVRAAGAAVEAARGAQAAAEAVLAGLQAHLPLESDLTPPQTRWQDEPVSASSKEIPTPVHAEPRWHDTIPPILPESRDVWEEMRVAPQPDYAREPLTFSAIDENAIEDATIEPVQTSIANLIEFPRELVAARKARPRLAEQPLTTESAAPQLSIFEVDPGMQPAAETAAPEWTRPSWSRLDEPKNWQEEDWQHPALTEAATLASPDTAAIVDPEFALRTLPQIAVEEPAVEEYPAAVAAQPADVAQPEPAAPMQPQTMFTAEPVELFVADRSYRLLAGIVDAGLVTLAYLGAATVVLAATDHPPSGKIALIATAVGLVLFAILYQALFFAFSEEGTPGMRYARIALCTFDDNNPTVAQSLLRIPATMAAVLPVGLGLLWSLVDRDRLGLQDRLSKTYQRKY